MLSMIGNTARLWRYKIDYLDDIPDINEDENPADKTIEAEIYVISEEQKDIFATVLSDKVTSITDVEQTANEWIDGMEFESRAKALEALEMGEKNYKKTVYHNSKEYLEDRILTLEDDNMSLMVAITELFEKGL